MKSRAELILTALVLVLGLGCGFKSIMVGEEDPLTDGDDDSSSDDDADDDPSGDDDPGTCRGVETCNGYDDDCDGLIDEDISTADCDLDPDSDNDGFCRAGTPDSVSQCQAGDCDDSRGDRNPGAEEVCDGSDNDCDDAIDEDCLTGECPGGCDDGDSCTEDTCSPVDGGTFYHCINEVIDDCVTCPSAPQDEECNEIDDDCDGLIDEDIGGLVCGSDVGGCQSGMTQCFAGAVTCVGEVGPEWEQCNGVDDDCDGAVDEGLVCSCPSGYADCDADYANGCETDLTANDSNCGGCGTACGPGEYCYAGACEYI